VRDQINLQVLLLLAAVLTLFWCPRIVPLWAGPTVLSLIAIMSGAISMRGAAEAARALNQPLLLLMFAVPLAVLLDRLGFFEAVAHRLGAAAHLHRNLWVLATFVVIVFNLDAAVVLLTPLYIRIARHHRTDARALAFQPVLLACLGSGLLPISNLTNLLAAARFHLGASTFFIHMALPTFAAVVVGWRFYQRVFREEIAGEVCSRDDVGSPIEFVTDVQRFRSLVRGGMIVAFVLFGFTVGDALGIPAWAIAATAVVVLVMMTRSLPVRAVPWEAMLLTTALAILVAASVPSLHLDRMLVGGGIGGDLRAFGFGLVGSNASNNLPAALAGVGALRSAGTVWALSIGLNIGPLLVMSGSLSNLLWRDTARRLGVELTARSFSRVGMRIGLPAMLVALAVVVVQNSL
jgi:arsenical pump membrane protein